MADIYKMADYLSVCCFFILFCENQEADSCIDRILRACYASCESRMIIHKKIISRVRRPLYETGEEK